MTILVSIHAVDSDINSMFRNGTKSLWQIGLLFLGVAAIHPRFGFTTKKIQVLGDNTKIKPEIISYMNSLGFILDSNIENQMIFKYDSKVKRLVKMFEDQITITRQIDGYSIEGLTKEVIRIANGLNYKFNKE